MGLYTGSKVVELTPSDFNAGARKVVSKKLSGKPGYVMFYADWCGHCLAKEEMWKFLAEGLKKEKQDFVVAVVDTVKYPELTNNMGVRGFPTTFSFDRQGMLKEYNNGYRIEDLLGFACENHKAVCGIAKKICDGQDKEFC